MKRFNGQALKKMCAGVMLLTGAIGLTSCGSKAQDSYKQALSYSSDGDYDNAVKCYEDAISVNPEKAEYYIDYGFVLMKTGEYSEAITQFNKAILSSDDNIVEPDNKITRTNNKRAYRGKGIACFEIHDYESAVTNLENALKINELSELNEDIIYYLADSLKLCKRQSDALKLYEGFLDNAKDKAAVYGNMAECCKALGNTDKAIEYYDEAIKLSPDCYDYYIGKYNIYLEEGDEQEAYKVVESALAIKDNSDKAVLYKGELYYMTGEIEKASGYLKQAAQDGYYEGDYYLAKIYMIAQDYDNAISCLDEYISSDEGKRSAGAYVELIKLYISQKDYEKAKEINEIALSLNNSNYDKNFRYFEIAVLEGEGELEQALEKAKQYNEKYPDDEDMKRELVFLGSRIGNTGDDSDSQEQEG